MSKPPEKMRIRYGTTLLGLAFLIVFVLVFVQEFKKEPAIASIVTGSCFVFVGLVIGVSYLIHRIKSRKK